MDSTIVILGNGFDIDLGLKTKFADFIGSSHFSKYAFTPLMNQILCLHDKDARWCDIEQVLRDKFISYQNNPSKEVYDDINYSWQLINKAWGIYLPEITELKNTILKRHLYGTLLTTHHHIILQGLKRMLNQHLYMDGFPQENKTLKG